jgi:hypothetical protein
VSADYSGGTLPLSNASITGTAPVTIAASAITITKVATYTPVAANGDADLTDGSVVITYSYVISNIGTVDVDLDDTLVDDQLGNLSINSGGGDSTSALAPNTATTATFTTTITPADLPFSPSPLILTNVATATGTDIDNNPVSATATADVPFTLTVELEVVKVVTWTNAPAEAAAGDDLEYEYFVLNSTPFTFSTVSLSDNQLGALTTFGPTFAPQANSAG